MRHWSRFLVALTLVLTGFATAPAPSVAAEDSTPPSPPTNLQVQRLSFTEVTLRWSPSTDDSGWLLYEVEVRGPGYLQSWAALEPTKTFTALPQGVTFTATVVAVDGAHNRSASTSIQFTTPIDTTTPTAPTNLRAVMTNGVLTAIAWDPATDNSTLTYYLFSGGNRIFGGTATSVSVQDLLYVYCIVLPGSTHTLTVQAIDISNHLSTASNTLTVTFPE